MKHFYTLSLVSLFVVSTVGSAWSAIWDIDLAHSEVGFKIRHLVSKTKGRFDSFSGTIEFDIKKPKNIKVNVDIETQSLNTNNEKRDAHLRNADFFNVEKFPKMTFTGNKSKKAGKNKYKVMGELTMLGVSKPVSLDVEYLGETTDPWGGTRNGFTVSGNIDRKDWGMVYNITDKGGVVVGDKVEILIEIEGVKKK